ncbi:MAG: phosphopyruvate hydratase [Planctomycetia bacterium]|nr:phosphopyruvate hydratase [Planctomycetia bacterium]
METLIEKVVARQILDSRGIPTVEVDVVLENGKVGRASTPSGLSRGSHEAFELRDNLADFYAGRSVWQAVNNVNVVLAEKIVGMNVFRQKEIDDLMIELDGTPDKHRLGANAILPVSLAVARGAAESLEVPLYRYLGGIFATGIPIPMVNVLNGGAHADNRLDIQEFMLVPHSFSSFADSLRATCETFYSLKRILHERGLSTNVGDEGGFAPDLESHEEAFDLLIQAIESAGYLPERQISLAIDAASNEFFEDGAYYFEGAKRTAKEMALMFEGWTQKYPICSIEDGMAQDDWLGWLFLNEILGDKIMIVGDDLFASNRLRIEKGVQKRAANAVLVKPNQVGTLTETFESIRFSQNNGLKIILSHRSGETIDAFIADLSVAVHADYIKSGSVSRTERTAKYNQLFRIESDMS